MRSRATLIVVAILFAALPADARKPKKQPAAPPPPSASEAGPVPAEPAAPPPPTEPAPGACSYLQPGVKICSTLQGQGSFDVITYPPAVVFVRLEEPVTSFVAPPDVYFQAAYQGNTVTIAPLRQDLPERIPTIISTASLNITLNLRPGSLAKADTQVTIRDPRRASRDAEIDRQVQERLAPLEKKLADERRTLEERARARAADIVLSELAREGLAVRQLEVGPARNSQLIVIRARQLVRVGGRRYVLFSVENLSRNPYQVRNVRLRVGDQVTAAAWRFATATIGVDEEVQAAVEIPARVRRPLSIEVEEADPRRNVTLSGIDAR